MLGFADVRSLRNNFPSRVMQVVSSKGSTALTSLDMAAQLAFAAALAGDEAVLAEAVLGLPGLTVDKRFGTFPTWTQANERARRLNEGLGLTQSQAQAIVTEVRLAAHNLIDECDSILQMARELGQRQRQLELTCLLAQMELGVTFCRNACTRHDVRKERLLRDARKTLSRTLSAMHKFEFGLGALDELRAGIDRLQAALDDWAPEKSNPAPTAPRSFFPNN